ncbi:hypothetical protein H4684_000359 [Desulfomicrobium macestii]|uniref:Uncharacterized protein n=1 Tax=Desulfomicrobium macestii TaxID=90731 RepID=A0ABR9GZ53_9BACT|nr:hypothetical protein [Desulfomicrobium macestii]MBE1423738.1 hypothetical protein [Desulfomicrobium macestii]
MTQIFSMNPHKKRQLEHPTCLGFRHIQVTFAVDVLPCRADCQFISIRAAPGFGESAKEKGQDDPPAPNLKPPGE